MSYAQVNGLNMYCEVRRSGRPLVVLHAVFRISKRISGRRRLTAPDVEQAARRSSNIDLTT